MKDHWDAQAEKFEAEWTARTAMPGSTKGARSTVRVFQTLTGLVTDGKAGGKTFSMLRRLFPAARKPMTALPDKLPVPPLCSVERDGFYPMADDSLDHLYRVTSGHNWRGRPNHPAQDFTRRMGKGSLPDTDGTFGAPKGSRVLACLPGVVVDIDQRGRYHSVTLRHNTEEFGECYSYYLHIDGPVDGLFVGQLVAGGEFIAWNGTTGTDLRHLHWMFCVASKIDRAWKRDDWPWLVACSVNLGGTSWDTHNKGWLGKWKRTYLPL